MVYHVPDEYLDSIFCTFSFAYSKKPRRKRATSESLRVLYDELGPDGAAVTTSPSCASSFVSSETSYGISSTEQNRKLQDSISSYKFQPERFTAMEPVITSKWMCFGRTFIKPELFLNMYVRPSLKNPSAPSPDLVSFTLLEVVLRTIIYLLAKLRFTYEQVYGLGCTTIQPLSVSTVSNDLIDVSRPENQPAPLSKSRLISTITG